MNCIGVYSSDELNCSIAPEERESAGRRVADGGGRRRGSVILNEGTRVGDAKEAHPSFPSSRSSWVR